MPVKFIISFVVLCTLLVGCSDCSSINKAYAGVRADTTYFAYAKTFEYDSTLFPNLTAYRNDNLEPLTVRVDYDNYYRGNHIIVEIYGCRTNSCTDANTIVVRSGDYFYTELFFRPQFEISEAKGSVPMDGFMEKTIYSRFHLSITTTSIYVSWDFEDGIIVYDEQCRAPLNPGW